MPILRVFGITEHGQKVCAHVHGVFPYLYVLWSGAAPTVAARTALAAAINAALHKSLGRTGDIKEEVSKSWLPGDTRLLGGPATGIEIRAYERSYSAFF